MAVVEVSTELHPAGRVVLRDDRLERFEAMATAGVAVPPQRLVYAAAHVVMHASYADVSHSVARPGAGDEIESHIDWLATMAIRRRLDDLSFGVAEAMDTAQRFSLGWPAVRRLVQDCGALQLANGFMAGAGTDHVAEVVDTSMLVDGVAYQANLIRAAGGDVILLPMPQLTRWHADANTYVDVYRSILQQIEGPVFIHWLGPMFMAELAGYFPDDSFRRVMRLDPGKVRGAKLSLLDAGKEIELRRQLLVDGQIMLTGDDFHFGTLIAGDPAGARPIGLTKIGVREVPVGAFSHALLGIFDGIARPAAVALRLLAQGDHASFLEIMAPCEELSRVVFADPTRFYKSGLAFLAWLDGQQDNPMLVNHEENARDVNYYLRVADLASRCGVFRDAELTAARLRRYLEQVAK